MSNIPEEVPENDLEDIPTDEDPEVVGGDVAQTDGGGELGDETDGADKEARQGKTLGTSGSLQGFGGNDTLQRSVGEGEDNVEEVVECQGGLTLGLANGASLGDGEGNTGVDGHGDSASYVPRISRLIKQGEV